MNRMKMRMKWYGFVAMMLMAATFAAAQQTAWTVKPEWVRAHEEFLSSDALGGRGSATRDEQIAATYVASEFMSYGLKPAPGMTGYIQSAEVVAPSLDGKATLTVGNVVLHEGVDFTLLTSPGTAATGPLQRGSAARDQKPDASSARGSVLLLDVVHPQTCVDCTQPGGRSTMQEMAEMRRTGAAILIGLGDPQMDAIERVQTRTPIRLKDAPERPAQGGTTILVNGPSMDRLLKQKDGSTVNLEVHPLPQDKPRSTFNAVGYLAGSEPSADTILLSAHLDHLGIGARVNGDAIYNGANDDAAGTTAVLELAHALASGPKLKRNVLFVCYGSEELGALGSTYFGQHPPVPLTSLVTNLEFEMIGNQDPKMPKGVLLLTGWERSNLGPTLRDHGALLGPDPYPEQHFFQRSDNYALALRGVVAHTAAGWGTPPTYHQPNDDMEHLDLAFMTNAIQSLVEPMRWLASSDFRPEWNKGGQPKSRE